MKYLNKMKTYRLQAEVLISVYTEVEAETLEQAIELSQDRDIETYHFNDKNQARGVWVSDRYDGEPENIKES